jgi:Ca-activated chloride channel family protein
MLSLVYKPLWIILIQFTFCLADSQSSLIKLNDVETGMMLVEDEKEGYYYEIPKLKTDVKIKVDGMVASATVDQMFTNDGDIPIEAIYVFPLPEEAAVYEMQMLIGNRLIESLVKEKEEAKKIYTKAKKEGKRASLTEQERPNLSSFHTTRVSPFLK